jgi:hypothetical protein
MIIIKYVRSNVSQICDFPAVVVVVAYVSDTTKSDLIINMHEKRKEVSHLFPPNIVLVCNLTM